MMIRCPVCSRELRSRADGLVRDHAAPSKIGGRCQGSNGRISRIPASSTRLRDDSCHLPDAGHLIHECEDGHSWREQPDGGVSPSWGMALTSVKYPGWDPTLCPEPKRNRDGTITCAGCRTRFYIAHGTPGVMCDGWNYDERCQPAPPACGKPAVKTLRWDHSAKAGGWIDVTPRQLTIEDLVAA